MEFGDPNPWLAAEWPFGTMTLNANSQHYVRVFLGEWIISLLKELDERGVFIRDGEGNEVTVGQAKEIAHRMKEGLDG